MAVAPPRAGRSSRARLALLLAASYALRVWLAIRGGEGFWPDEARYGVSRDAVYEISHRQWAAAFRSLLGGADHVFFRWLGLPVAALEHLVGSVHPALAACYFALFSVGALYLVWAVAIRAGATEPEALWAAFFAAAASSLFYYTRHYLPYDAALFVMMLSLWLAVGPWSPRSSVLAGVAAGFGFLTYNGYWLLGACILVLHALIGSGGMRRLTARASLAFLGLLLPMALFFGLGAAVAGGVLRSYEGFAATVKQGDFHVGYRVVPQYLWAAEGPMLLVLLAAFVFAFTAPAPGRRRRLLWWSGAIAGLYTGLVLFSDVVPVFMVYGRLSRCVVPFLCLGAGAGAAGFLEGRGNGRAAWAWALFLLVALLGAANLSVPLRQVFPEGFAGVFTREIPDIPAGNYGFYRLLGAETRLDRILEDGAKRPGSRELLRRPNPLQFRPYQFEGFTESERARLNSGDVAMRVLKVPMDPYLSGLWDRYPGPVRFTATLPADRMSLTEPLASSGSAGRGDIIFVRYVDPGHVQFGQDHWGAVPVLSDVVDVDYGRRHTFVISAGSLLPPEGSSLYLREPWLLPMAGHLLVMMDGRPVLSRHSEFYSHPPASILFGVNVIGGSAVGPGFTGDVSDFGQAPLKGIDRYIGGIAGVALARERPPEWAGAVGPVRIHFRMPAAAPGSEVGQPLASVVGPGLKQVLFITREGGKVRFGLDTFGSAPTWSEPLEIPASGADAADVSMGPVLPDGNAPIYGRAPGFVAMRGMTYVRFNGRIVLLASSAAVASDSCRIEFGANVPGSTACGPYFKGEITSVEAIGLREITTGSRVPGDALEKLARPGWGGHTGPLQVDLVFAEGKAGESQPILATGVAGAGDVVFVQYEPGGMARLCVDHWGSRLLVSGPFALAAGSRHELVLGLGSLFPAGGQGVPTEAGRIRLILDGRTLIDREEACYPCRPETVTLGASFIGGSTTGPAFFGEILGVRGVP